MTDIHKSMNKIKQLEQDIRSLSIQGATNVALSTLKGVKIAIESAIDEFQKLQTIGERLAYARPTEPLAQNAVRFIFAQKDKKANYYLERSEEYKSLIFETKEKMARNGVSFIQNGGVYLTHCHSSTVVSMFKEARRQGKRFSIFATETRPLFQGRKTVIELLEAGIEDVTLIIDDVASSILEGRLKHIDAVFIGADLLSQNGFVNKVGSLGIAYAAERGKIPLYCLSILLKYDPRPYSPSLIEQRGGYEIWPEAPKDLSFYAPAFDFIPYRLDIKLICEKGLLESKDVENQVFSSYPFLRQDYDKSV